VRWACRSASRSSTAVSPNRAADWDDIPGTVGCALENRLFRDRWPAFVAAGVAVHGVSTQRPEDRASFCAAEDVPFPLRVARRRPGVSRARGMDVC
jgi:AhpC/TSA family